MALIAIQYKLVPESPILVAANREERYDRLSNLPVIQSGKPRVLCGIDRDAGVQEPRSHILGDAGPDAVADHHESRIRFGTVNLSEFAFDKFAVVELDAVDFRVAASIEFVAELLDVRDVERIETVDEYRIDFPALALCPSGIDLRGESHIVGLVAASRATG